jgi:hypothetical protein
MLESLPNKLTPNLDNFFNKKFVAYQAKFANPFEHTTLHANKAITVCFSCMRALYE